MSQPTNSPSSSSVCSARGLTSFELRIALRIKFVRNLHRSLPRRIYIYIRILTFAITYYKWRRAQFSSATAKRSPASDCCRQIVDTAQTFPSSSITDNRSKKRKNQNFHCSNFEGMFYPNLKITHTTVSIQDVRKRFILQ